MIGFGIYQRKEEGTDIFVTEQNNKEVWKQESM